MSSRLRQVSLPRRLFAGLACCLAPAAHAQSIDELRDMSIEALAEFDVTSVTKTATTLGDTPAALFVITHDDIVRSGNITLPGILRVAPNLQIMRGTPNTIVVAARGLSGNLGAQNFSNKLQVMIDGRSVYSPLYSGVYWDMQDVLPEDVERIEVLSGPGATLWGANAMNGVINVVTRNAGASQGLYGTGVLGNRTYDAGLRYGGRLGDAGNYRLFVKRHENFESSEGANDDVQRTQIGFRADWSTSEKDVFMVQADGYMSSRSQRTDPDEKMAGYDILARWTRVTLSGSRLQVQAYYDHAEREILNGTGRYAIDTIDLDLQHSLTLGAHSIVWGGGVRSNRYEVYGVPGIEFLPGRETLFLANAFVQDSIALTPALTLTGGLKLEYGPFDLTQLLPSARIAWKPTDTTLLWGAVSRAVRSPTPFERNVREYMGSAPLLTGRADFRSEKLTAWEIGTRIIPSQQVSISISGFYNQYDDLRSIDPTQPGAAFPLTWGNGLAGTSYGFDSWADIRVADWWRIRPGYSLLLTNLHFKPGTTPLTSTSQAGNDPEHRAFFRTSMDIGPQVNLDADLRYVSALPDPHVPAYVELGARIGWQFVERAEVSVSGFNLLHDRHQELPLRDARPVGRSVFVALKWTL